MANRLKSFETVLEEERREVLALLEKRPSRRPKRAGSSSNPRRASSPLRTAQRPVRSIVDAGRGPASRRRSTPGVITERPQEGRSMLDIDSLGLADTPDGESSDEPAAENSTKESHVHHRSLSDTTFRPSDLDSLDADFILSSAYKLSGYLSSNSGPPKPTTLTAKYINSSGSSQSGLMKTDSNNSTLTDSTVTAKNSTSHRLSDTNLAAGHRSSISSGNSSGRASSGDATKPGRPILKKESAFPEDEEAVAESSEDDERTSDEEQHRGRKKELTGRGRPGAKSPGVRISKGPKSALGRAAAAERDGVLCNFSYESTRTNHPPRFREA